MAWFDLSKGSKIGWKWPLLFHERQITKSQRNRHIPPPFLCFLAALNTWSTSALVRNESISNTSRHSALSSKTFDYGPYRHRFSLIQLLSCSNLKLQLMLLLLKVEELLFHSKWKKTGPCRWFHQKNSRICLKILKCDLKTNYMREFIQMINLTVAVFDSVSNPYNFLSKTLDCFFLSMSYHGASMLKKR